MGTELLVRKECYLIKKSSTVIYNKTFHETNEVESKIYYLKIQVLLGKIFIRTHLYKSISLICHLQTPLFPKCKLQHDTKHSKAHGCVDYKYSYHSASSSTQAATTMLSNYQ